MPLKQRSPPDGEHTWSAPFEQLLCAGGDLEDAAITHGDGLGPHPELGELQLERDERFPLRITVQLYLATELGRVGEPELRALHERIDAIYSSRAAGSLVLDPDSGRPTEHGVGPQRAWWGSCWGDPQGAP